MEDAQGKAETVKNTKTVYICVQSARGRMQMEFVKLRSVCCWEIGLRTKFPRKVALLKLGEINASFSVSHRRYPKIWSGGIQRTQLSFPWNKFFYLWNFMDLFTPSLGYYPHLGTAQMTSSTLLHKRLVFCFLIFFSHFIDLMKNNNSSLPSHLTSLLQPNLEWFC